MKGSAQMTALVKLQAGCIFSLLVAQPVYADAPVQEGRQDSIEDCSACHRVTRNQKPPPPVPNPDEALGVDAPSFDKIARLYAGRPAALAAFIQAPRHPMREQQFLSRDLKAIVRYIGSLRNQRW